MEKTAKKYTVKCSNNLCNNYYYARGLCRKHYRMLLGKEGGYKKDYLKARIKDGYKKMKSESDKKYREKLKKEGKLSKKQHTYYLNYISNPENIEKKKQQSKEYYHKTKESRREISAAYARRYRDEIKDKVLRHYSNNELKCANCGIDVYSVLSLDHINNDGAEHKKSLSKNRTRKVSSSRVYSDLVRRNFPSGYQVLCFNCNYHKEFMRR